MNAPASAPVGADPVLAPPIYGQWHAGRRTVTPGAQPWLNRLNLDPRWRVAAAFGTRVIQQNQEALMASAWDQMAEVQDANQRLRQLQLSCSIGKVLHDRHFSKLSPEKMLRIASPAFARLGLTDASGPLLARQARSPLPLGANRSAMRRIGRHRGPLSRRTAAQGVVRTEEQSWVSRLMTLAPMPPPPAGPPPKDISAWPPALPTAAALQNGLSNFGVLFVQAENIAPTFPGTPTPAPHYEVPGFFRSAALDHIPPFFAVRPAPPAPDKSTAMTTVVSDVLKTTDPLPTIVKLAKAVITTGDNRLPPTAKGISPTGLETLMFTPKFPAAMYEPLREVSQDLFLPGLETVKPETVLALQTNQPFIEAYMVGLNHEMGRELLWRAFPTDQRGTCFSNFWAAHPSGQKGEIDDLTTWGDRDLGASSTSGSQFVLLLRSRLLTRYPNAAIFLAPAIASPGTPGGWAPNPATSVMPIFTGALDPDLTYFGFPVAARDAIATPGYFVVIQEHPTEPRFGIDAASVPPGTNYLTATGPLPAGMTWGSNAAQMAAQTRRRPARVALHASRLIAHA